jgi:hypothetical protein
MKTKIITNSLILLLALVIAIPSIAQNGARRKKIREQIDAQKVAFITEKLQLTPAEAQQFWPIYNEYEAQRQVIVKEFMGKNLEEKDLDIETLTDKQALEIADSQIIQAQKMLDLRKKYHAEFKKVLPPKKLLLLYQAERDFKKFMLKEIRQRVKEERNNRRGR